MSELRFRGNSWPTLGVEVELQLVDSRTMALRSAIAEILGDLPASLQDSVKPEFMQRCGRIILERLLDSGARWEADLAPKIRTVERAADRHGVRLFWAASRTLFSRGGETSGSPPTSGIISWPRSCRRRWFAR